MVIFYTLAVSGIGIGFIFANGLIFALCYYGAAMLPCIAVAGMKWGC